MKATMMSLVQALQRRTGRPEAAPDEPLMILIVDDEAGIRTYVDRVLTRAGYRTMLALDGADAIAVAARGPRVDLLLTDVVMPMMTGAQLAVRLRQDDPDLKVLYLSGYSDRLFVEKTWLFSEEAYLDKPCTPVELLQAVSLAITGSIHGHAGS